MINMSHDGNDRSTRFKIGRVIFIKHNSSRKSALFQALHPGTKREKVKKSSMSFY
jgi:hypothetical protein